MPENKFIIFTDGSSRGNPGPGGYGTIVCDEENGTVTEIGGYEKNTTNNRMELRATIEALSYLKKKKVEGSIEIFSDSKYVILGITQWIENWMKNNWKNANKKKVLNQDLWEALYALTQEFKPKWSYVKGHNGHERNERADEIATSFADGTPVDLIKDI